MAATLSMSDACGAMGSEVKFPEKVPTSFIARKSRTVAAALNPSKLKSRVNAAGCVSAAGSGGAGPGL